MALSPTDWHRRFQQQARWTRDLRHYLFERVGASSLDRILSVGCGTGAILEELSEQDSGKVQRFFGLDINDQFLGLAHENAPRARLTCGDAYHLPYPGASFDLSLCHFLLLWVGNPLQVLAEMRRVTRPGHAILALAEPDYGGRIDYPAELEQLGEWQQAALRRQGADPQIGRQLAGLFSKTGLKEIESGVLGGQWSGPPEREAWDSEWAMLRADLAGSVPAAQLDGMQAEDRRAWQRGERVLYVPTFYAWGRVP